MKKFIAKNLEEFNITPTGMDIWCEEIGDEYHTISELYDHRMALTIALTKYYRKCQSFVGFDRVSNTFRSKLHADGIMFEGNYFIVGFTNNENKCIISYHYNLKYWNKFEHCLILDKAPEYDGHTSQDVIERLMNL